MCFQLTLNFQSDFSTQQNASGGQEYFQLDLLPFRGFQQENKMALAKRKLQLDVNMAINLY